jgi:hypothetical protein
MAIPTQADIDRAIEFYSQPPVFSLETLEWVAKTNKLGGVAEVGVAFTTTTQESTSKQN